MTAEGCVITVGGRRGGFEPTVRVRECYHREGEAVILPGGVRGMIPWNDYKKQKEWC